MSKEIEVVLVQDVKGLGKFGQTKMVKLGYARNFLLPYQYAILSTPANQLRFKSIQKREAQRRAEEQAAAALLATQINGKSVVISATAQESGALYGSVSAADIVAAFQTQHGVEIDRHAIGLEENFKEIGDYQVDVSLQHGVQASISVTVVADEAKASKKSK